MKKTIAALALSVGLAGCGELDVPDLNNPSLDDLAERPTRSSVLSGSTGLLLGARTNYAPANGYVAMTGILGRELYNFDNADPRFITEMLVSPQLDPGSPAFGGNLFAEHYANIRNAGVLYQALDRVAGVTDAEKEAMRGFAKTIEAWDFLMVAVTRERAPIDVHRPIGSELAPLEDNAAVLAHVAKLLDEADVHLAAGGSAFPFPLSSGFSGLATVAGSGFDTPAGFRKFNRALKARTSVYRQEWQAALDALDASFLDATRPMSYGVYHAYSVDSGDVANGLNSKNLYVHPSVQAGMDVKENGAPDDRVARAVVAVDAKEKSGLTSSAGFTKYKDGNADVPIIRNEELLLLRAEARLQLSQVPQAAADINLVRQISGGLPARTDLDATNILDELLKQRAYSLLFEGGHKWIDARRYGRLQSLPLDRPDHHRHAWFPLPSDEVDARE